MRRTVNSGINALRNLLWSGGSSDTNQPGTSSADGAPTVRDGRGKPSCVGLELMRGSVRTARTSSCLVTSHTVSPDGSTAFVRPGLVRNPSYSGGGNGTPGRRIMNGTRSVLVMSHTP